MARLGDLIKLAKVIRCDNGNYPVLSMTMHDGIILQSSRFKKSIASIDKSNYKVVQYGQLVVGFPIDEGVLYIQKVTTAGIMSPAYNIWDVDTSLIDINYLEYCLHSPQSMQFYKANLRGTTARRRSIPTDILLELFIPLPSLDEQRRIAALLDKVSDLIAKRRAQLDKLDLLVKARFVEMFGDPVVNPMGWEKRTLKEVCTKLTDGTHFSPESFETGDFKYITAKNIKENGFDFSAITYVSEKVHRPIFERCNPEFGDILYIKDGVTTGVAMINTLKEEFSLLSSVALLKQNRSIIDGYFLCGVLNNKEMYTDIRSNMGGAAITRLTIAKLNKIQIILPPVELQRHFASYAQQIEKIKTTVNCSLNKLEILKKALMQQYFG